MKIENLVGINPSKVACTRCGFGKWLAFEDTKGEVSPELQARFENIALTHEQRRPTHTDVTVLLYRQSPSQHN